jgi:hypothetical protein
MNFKALKANGRVLGYAQTLIEHDAAGHPIAIVTQRPRIYRSEMRKAA